MLHNTSIDIYWTQRIVIQIQLDDNAETNKQNSYLRVNISVLITSMLNPFCADYLLAVTFCPDNAPANLAHGSRLHSTKESSCPDKIWPEITRRGSALMHRNQIITK